MTLYDLDDSPSANPRTTYSQASDEISAQIPAQGAPLSQHCVSCHGDGTPTFLPTGGSDNTQSSPFINSGPVTGTLVLNGGDTTVWDNAGHNNSTTIGCVGCHVGHGSTAASLLDPDPPVFTINTPAETDDYFTNFCINCHDADGPSGANIAAEFMFPLVDGTGANYVVTGMNSQTNNQRHDVTGASPPAVGCPDCHSPHADNATNPVRNPETGAALVSYNPANYGGGSDPTKPEGNLGAPGELDYIQFCLVCHDGTPVGDSVAAYDIASSYLGGKQHGNGNGSTGTKIGKGNLKPPWTTAADYALGQDPANNYAALNCTTCHGPHGTGNIYSLRESITVGETPMEIGSDDADGQYPKPTFSGFTYTLPLDVDGKQFKDGYGAWCTFCHNMNSGHTGVTEASTCNSGHRHGGNNF